MAAEPGGCEAICLAWARHHFAGADSAVLEYVCSSLAAAVEDGDSLPQLAESLQDFLPPGGSQALLHSGLQELEAALREPGAAQRSYAWLQPQHAAPEASREGGGGAADADAAAAQAPESAQPPPAGRSTLSIGAAEFRPRDDAAALAADLQTLQLGDSGGSQPVDAAAAEWSDATGWAEHPSSSGWQQGGWAEADASSGERWQQQGGQGAADAAADAAAEREMVAGGPEAEEAFLAVLGDQFPLFSDAALRQLFAEQGGSLAATIHTLCGLEAELEGQQQAHGAALGSSCQVGAGRWASEGCQTDCPNTAFAVP